MIFILNLPKNIESIIDQDFKNRMIYRLITSSTKKSIVECQDFMASFTKNISSESE